MARCRHDALTPVMVLCPDCKQVRERIRNRHVVRRSRPPVQNPGTVTIQPAQARALLDYLDDWMRSRGHDDALGALQAAESFIGLLQQPLEQAREEITEEIAKEAMRLAQYKLPVKTKFITTDDHINNESDDQKNIQKTKEVNP